MPLARRSAPVRCACSLQSLGRKPVRNSHSSSSRFRSFIPAQYHFHRNSTIIKLAPMFLHPLALPPPALPITLERLSLPPFPDILPHEITNHQPHKYQHNCQHPFIRPTRIDLRLLGFIRSSVRDIANDKTRYHNSFPSSRCVVG